MRVLLASLLIGCVAAVFDEHAEHSIEKRVAVKTSNSAALTTGQFLPVVIPPYNITEAKVTWGTYGSCLFYSEGVNIVVYRNNKGGQYASAVIRYPNATWTWDDGDVVCPNNSTGTFEFTATMTPTDDVTGYYGTTAAFTLAKGQPIKFKLTIFGDDLGYWNLVNATVLSDLAVTTNGDFLDKNIKVAAQTMTQNVDHVGMNSVYGWAWGCYSSQAMFFTTDDQTDPTAKPNYLVGISLYNTEIQPYGAYQNSTEGSPPRILFTLNMDDCVGTFSVGSWMGIVSGLVLLSGLIFGYLMLQSVQTMDRFDDPKQKQIIINVRE